MHQILNLKDLKEQKLQHLSLAHINTQKIIEEKIKDITTPFSLDFQKEIHKEFYTQKNMGSFLKISHENKEVNIIPGELRELDVQVGSHIATPYANIENEMVVFNKSYDESMRFERTAIKILNIFSAHHRLLWIHPFLDGNGRVSRLLTDALLMHIGIEGYGLWNISRGLARENTKYKNLLAHADELRVNSYDGRGNLSKKALYDFVNFMLDISIDQISYMKSMLKIDNLMNKVENYVKFSQSNMYNIEPLPKHSYKILKELLIKGEIKRGDVSNIIGTKQTIASNHIKELIHREYIQSDSIRGDIRIKFNAHFAMKIFPELIPEV